MGAADRLSRLDAGKRGETVRNDNPSVACGDSSLYTREPWGAAAPEKQREPLGAAERGTAETEWMIGLAGRRSRRRM